MHAWIPAHPTRLLLSDPSLASNINLVDGMAATCRTAARELVAMSDVYSYLQIRAALILNQ